VIFPPNFLINRSGRMRLGKERGTEMKKTILAIAIATFVGSSMMTFSPALPGAVVQAEKKEKKPAKPGGERSGKCTVVGGPNNGKTGTYTDGGTWCEGEWGGTECTGPDGQGSSGKCKDKAAVTKPPASINKVPGGGKARG
jgi:hypothetical protein